MEPQTTIHRICLFDSIHDFGKFGTPYDYIPTEDGVNNGARKTTFNHIRRMFTIGPEESVANSRLQHGVSHRTTSIQMNQVEAYFLDRAVNVATETRVPSATWDPATVNYNEICDFFGATNGCVFSIDTQKKLYDAMLRNRKLGITTPAWQLLDQEKVFDPGSHSFDTRNDEGITLLQEVGGQTRVYRTDVLPGRFGVQLGGFSRPGGIPGQTRITIDGEGPVDVKMNQKDNHVNCITVVNRAVQRVIVASRASINVGAVDISNPLPIYAGLERAIPATAGVDAYAMQIQRLFSQKRFGDQLQVLSCKNNNVVYENLSRRMKCTFPIFVSIDRMAIAFAIMNGVNCILDKGRRGLVAFRFNPCVLSPTTSGGQLEVPKPLKMFGGAIDEDVKAEIKANPWFLLIALGHFQFADVSRVSTNTMKTLIHTTPGIYSFMRDDREGFKVRNSHNGGIFDLTSPDDIAIANPADISIVLRAVVTPQHVNLQINTARPSVPLAGLFSLLDDQATLGSYFEMIFSTPAEQGGGGTSDQVKFALTRILGYHDIMSILSDEQRAAWYDEIYIVPNGVPVYVPSHLEFYFFIAELFQYSGPAKFTSLLPAIGQNNTPFGISVKTQMYSMLEYCAYGHVLPTMPPYNPQDMEVFTGLLDSANKKYTNFLGQISALNEVQYADACYSYGIKPFVFANTFSKSVPGPAALIEQDNRMSVAVNGGRTRRLTTGFLQTTRHQSIKMSSKRHSLSGKPAKR